MTVTLSGTTTQPPAQQAPAAAPDREAATEDLLVRARDAADETERRRLLDEVVLLNLPVARGLASRYRDRGEAFDDLLQVASLALVKAAQGYEPGKGRGFLAYAVPTITGELRRHFRDRGWHIRPPRRLQELRLSIEAAAQELSQATGHAPTVAELAAHLDASQEEVLEALAAAQGYTAASLDAPADGDEGLPLGETLGAEDAELERVVDCLAVEPLLARLSPRDRHILSLRFYRGWTQSQIAEDIGVTQMQVSRLLSKALARLRSEVLDDAA
ncbi:MAG: SigB/SigF/SigG family RNA polymerase sigma factor [Actinomycetota bacterium]